ncbi:MAG: 30S ribosomal protein S6 [Candidatus Margulisbacteria bacterium]|nr:30S ribosomal protein S6 [Candidatus Margulisiibacteriota bacterium]MBU1021949.1 30S ribosomal protein S6 [Candidatus Margulisiibacteriota bacterium]MBU1728928.1 30S ribosomal protein S6 [Candidatus Margulisiibacteriota bacterium]MBU1954734.1 30S ribosomal protein S6 [Candidatus Margulisiibacteriota bacterium]
MSKYDVLCIFDPKTEAAKIDAIIKKLESKTVAAGGIVEKVENRGSKPLPFRFKKHKDLKDVIYVNLIVEGPGKVPPALNEQLKVTEEILRSMITIKTEEEPIIEGKPTVPEEPKVEISADILAQGEATGGQS